MLPPGPVPAGTPNAPAARVGWSSFRASRAGTRSRPACVQVSSDRKTGTASNSGLDGSLFLNYASSGEEMRDNASLNEELWHLVNLMTLKAEWLEQGQPGDFKQFQDARTAKMAFDFRR